MSREPEKQELWPVVITGAGPVGLLLANLLGRRGIRCLLAEKRLAGSKWSKAIGVTPPSLEILRHAGLHKQVLQAGLRVVKALVHDERGTAGCVSFEDLPSPFRFILTLPQAETEKILLESLEQYPCITFRRGLELKGLELDGGVPRADFDDIPGGRSWRVRAQYVAGCDGSDSTVRTLAGIPFRKGRYRWKFVMADYEDNTSWGDEAHLFFTRDGSLESFPLPGGRRRWVSLVAGSPEAEPGAEYLEARVDDFCGCRLAGRRLSPVFRFVPEKIVVPRPACGRVMLAGDAAHVISPIGGQGMNTGFADAGLIASLMPELLRGGRASSQELMGEYNRRRRRAAASARRRAAAGMWIGTRTGRAASALRRIFLRSLLFQPPLAGKLAPHFAMLTIPHNKPGESPDAIEPICTEGER